MLLLLLLLTTTTTTMTSDARTASHRLAELPPERAQAPAYQRVCAAHHEAPETPALAQPHPAQ